MDMFDEAQAIIGMLKLCSMTQEELARKMGVSQSYIANKLRLLNLPDSIAARIKENNVSERHARSLLRLSDEAKQMEILEKVIERRLTARECEALVDSEYEAEIPNAIGTADRHRRTDVFLDTLYSSVGTLVSCGIDAKMHRSYYKNKMYITLSIEME